MTVDAPERPAHPAVSPWIRVAAYAVPLCVLPSASWRMSAVIRGLPEGCPRTMGWIEPYYVASLSIVSFGAALLTIGLVRRWGDVVPGWLPVIGGRKVPAKAAVIAALTGCAVLFALVAFFVLNMALGLREPREIPGCAPPTEGPGGWKVELAYAPLVAWPPLLLLVTVAYYRRRTATAPD